MRKFKLFIASACLSSGCGANTPYELEMRKFYLMPGEERAQKLASFPIEKQYDIYIWGVHNFHPSPLNLAEVIGDGGMSSAIYVASRMNKSNDPVELSGAIVVFEWAKLHGLQVCEEKKIVLAMINGLSKLKGTVHENSYRNIFSRTCPGLPS